MVAYDEFRESERSGWDARAGSYSDATARATLQSIPALLARANLFPGAKVLDAGCGPGYVAACADILGASSTGIDFSNNMITEARRRFPGTKFEVGDMEQMPLGDQSMDAVLSNIGLFHVTDPDRVMREAFRVLSPGGKFVFSQWLGPAESECYRMLFDVLRNHADMTLADPAPDAYVLSDRNLVSEKMESAGFAGISFEEVPNVLHTPGPSFFDFFMTFGVRVPLIVEKQAPETRKRIRDEIDERAGGFLADGLYRIPMPSLVVAAQRPSV
ncbi:class I SAM-dependent methyltransferase [Nitratireductor luteus]|uniref:class I SAM-dependent methyltransferase n=1 Tax=Nitratireductor luteus TaxID=2976980 RepID=UPI002240C35B|nr:class I SAM-dependent methyltransferase [Nitratireductor luteus]